MENIIIKTSEDVKVFFTLLKDKYKLSFHPDDSFEDYINVDTKESIFTNEEAEYFDKIMDASFEVCEKEEIDIYELGMSILN
jgi:hypothetical protein